MTNLERIANFVERFPGRDDDEISAALQIKPRQTVNQVCRELARFGRVERRQLPTGKIGNFPKSSADRAGSRINSAPEKALSCDGQYAHTQKLGPPSIVKVQRRHVGPRGKYDALGEYLSGSGQEAVSMTFAEISALVGTLPKSASLHQAWWGNHEGNSQAKAWMSAHYLAEATPSRRCVVFRKFRY